MAMIAISHVALSLYHWIVVALRLLADRNFVCRKFWRIKVINILHRVILLKFVEILLVVCKTAVGGNTEAIRPASPLAD